MTTVNRLRFAPLAAFLALAPAAHAQQQQPAPPSQQAAAAEEDDPQARAMVRRMAEHLAQARHFSVAIRASYDVVQDSGEKVELGENRGVTPNGPARIRVEAQGRAGQERTYGRAGTRV